MRTTAFLYKCFASLALLCAANTAWGQDNISSTYSSRTIQHKTATKWTVMRENLPDAAKNLDTFNDEKTYETNYLGDPIQPAHTYIDTIYVKKGADVELTLPIVAGQGSGDPPVNPDNPSTREYTRWYNFITEGTFYYQYTQSFRNYTGDLFDAYSGCYRVSNGYVSGRAFTDNQLPVTRMTFHYPTDSEYQTWSSGDNGLDNGAAGNKFYIIACDMSGYRDHTGSLQNYNFVEPTLGLRAIYYIVAVDGRGGDDETDMWKNGMGRLELPQYQGGDGVGKKFLEEYDIVFPADHIGNMTDELVALSKNVNSYRVDGDDNDNLHVTITSSNNINMRLLANGGADRPNAVSGSNNEVTSMDISGFRRTISFRPSSAESYKPWSVPDNSTATIVVTKVVEGDRNEADKVYNIAKFNLTFKKVTRLLTQHELDRIDRHRDDSSDPDNVIDTSVDRWFRSSYQYRTPKYLRANYELLTSRTFDYDPNVPGMFSGEIQSWYYPFPLDWGYSSYFFFDGSTTNYFRRADRGHGGYNNQPYAEWGNYAITNNYVGYGDIASNPVKRPTDEALGGRNDEGYFLYVDASDRPGTIVTLPFEENLCPGTELFFSAWVKSADENGETNENSAMLFTIIGITESGTRVPLYRQSTGQITTTSYIANDDDAVGTNEYTDANGYGSSQNDWYQIYFSYTNNSDLSDQFVSYELRVDNNCGSTQGGDFYLDEIEVFIAQPTAQIVQKDFACTGERTLMRAGLNWEQLCERTGAEADETATDKEHEGIDYCFIDEQMFNILMDGKDSTDLTVVANALEQSAVSIGIGSNVDDPEHSFDRQIASLWWNPCFDANTQYVADEVNLAIYNVPEGSQNAYFYKFGTADEGNRQLTVDFYAAMTPNTPYYMFILDKKTDGTTNGWSDFAAVWYDKCAIKSRFFVEGQTLIKINGEVAVPEDDYCEGEALNFTAQMRVPKLQEKADGVYEVVRDPQTGETVYDIIDEEVYFDWFFGSQDEFNMANPEHGGESLQSSLASLRGLPQYRDVESMDGVTPVIVNGETLLSQDHIDLINDYLTQEPATGGQNQRLVLHKTNLDIRILKSGTQLILVPIEIVRPSDSDITEEQWEKICWEYVPLNFISSGQSPKLFAGFNLTQYPEDFNPGLRIGLRQINEAAYTQTDGKRLKISLRGAEYTNDNVDYLGLVESNSDDADYTQIYLTATNDPAYQDLLNSPSYTETYLPIGKIHYLHAEEYELNSAFDNRAEVQFYLNEQVLVDGTNFTFTPREGYYYTFSINFAERRNNTSVNTNSCWGKFPMQMKVVPENLVWQGGADGALKNWNNDANWKRADATDLHAADGSYTTNDENETDNGFVPMLFSNVVMPEGSRAHLYMAGYVDGGAFQGKENRPEGMEAPTENIQYDLMVYDEDPDNNTGNLTTQRYRVNICNDIHFNQGAQMLHAEQLIYTKASMDVPVPTKEWTLVSTPLQSVVAGDWYTSKSTGSQAGLRLFNDVTFDTDNNDRLAPAVYQRSWADAANIIEQGGGTTPVSFEALWSSAYNDASVPYSAGAGFSIKAADAANNTGTLVFRMPKDDESYEYSSNELDRTNAGRLLISQMADRSTPSAYTGTKPITATLTPSADGKYMIVGNPFMAPLNVQDFLNANDNLDKVFWTETENGPVVGAASTGNWLTGSSLIPPYGAFFVRKADGATNNEVVFSAGMQELDNASSTTGTETNALVITASGTTKHSTAMLAYDDAAADAFSEGEDAQLITDLTGNGTEAPLAYTVAGTTAASINVVSTTRRIPMGVFAADDDVTTLTFSGTATLRNPRLYDAALQTETPLTDATTLSVSGASHGRYFIISDGAAPTGISGVDGDGATELSVYSVTSGEVIVAASAPIGLVNVYSAGGALLKSVDAAGAKECTVSGLPADVVVVRVALPGATEARKLKVKR